MMIWCCGCKKKVKARLTDGNEIHPHRPDLGSLPFWRCDECKNHVGCHHKTWDRTHPLGCIPTEQIRRLRRRIHDEIDPLWKNGLIKRRKIYRTISEALGREFHAGDIRSAEEAKFVLEVVSRMKGEDLKKATA